MMPAIKKAAVDMTMRVADLFAQNCAFKHGLVDRGGPLSIDLPEEKVEPPIVNNTIEVPPPTVIHSSTSPEVGASFTKSSLASKLAPFIIGLAAGGVGTGITSVFLPKQEVPPPVTLPIEAKEGSLLQYLQDRGQHLPEGQWPTQPQNPSKNP
jgi:hypothetical protein